MSNSNMKKPVTHHIYPKQGVTIEMLPPTWNDKRKIEALPMWLGGHLLEAFVLFEEHVKKFGQFAKKPIRITITAAEERLERSSEG